MSTLRLTITVPLLLAAFSAGCQALAPGAAEQLAGSQSDADQALARDDDTFSGRLATGTRQMTEAVSKPLDPTYWQQAQEQSQAKKRLKQKQAAALAKQKQRQQRSAFMTWLFPEPKQPRTLSEWLQQDRPDT